MVPLIHTQFTIGAVYASKQADLAEEASEIQQQSVYEVSEFKAAMPAAQKVLEASNLPQVES